MLISSNIALANSFDRFVKNKTAKSNLIEKISSGKRIARAADDASGLCISQSMKAQVLGMSESERDIQDGISLVQTIDGAVGEISKSLNRIKKLSIESANSILTDDDRSALQNEIDELKQNINEISNNTSFNGIKVLNSNKKLAIQVNDQPYMKYDLNLQCINTNALNIDNININSIDDANSANLKMDMALNKVIKYRTELGSDLNNLRHSLKNDKYSCSNLTSALSGIEDINMATALVKSVKQNIMINCNESMMFAARQSNDDVKKVLNKTFF